MRRAWVLIATAVLVAAMGAPAGAAQKQSLRGTMSLQEGFFGTAGRPCSGSGGYDDIRTGAQVNVRNDKGRVLAVGQLGAGVAVSAGATQYPTFMYCEFPFSARVPEAKFYAIEVSHRGANTYSLKDMKRSRWRVTLTLG